MPYFILEIFALFLVSNQNMKRQPKREYSFGSIETQGKGKN